MNYKFNPHRHVRIWFSSKPDSFLNLENQLRFIRMREKNPQDLISFVYDRTLLNDKAYECMLSFCKRHRIEPISIREHVFPYCTSEEQLLIILYEKEINHLNEGGNLASASDIVRWLGPIYRLGTYSDFDTHINTQELPETVNVQSPILLNLGSVTTKLLFRVYEFPRFNNDIISIVDEQAALPLIRKIQKAIYTDCRKELLNFKTAYTAYQKEEAKQIKDILGKFYKGFPTVHSNPDYFIGIIRSVPFSWIHEVRAYILQKTESNKQFCSPLSVAEYAAQEKVKILKQKKTTARQKNLQLSDEDLISLHRRILQISLIKTSVIYTTGPDQLLRCLGQYLYQYKKDSLEQTLYSYGLAFYGLDRFFYSKQKIGLHVKLSKAAYEESLLLPGESNDLSWMEEGQKRITKREETLVKAAGTIWSFYKAHKIPKTTPEEIAITLSI